MTDQTLPVDDELIVSYDDISDVTDQIDELRDCSDWAALHELATDLAHDLELTKDRLATAYERLDQTTTAADAAYIVVKGDFFGNEQAGFEHIYGSDQEEQPSREKAVSHGWEVHGHDDWLILKLIGGKAARLSWMDEERDDGDELAEVARQLSLEVAR